MRVHQLLSGAGPFDAVTAQAFAYRRLFDSWGWDGCDHAGSIDPRMDGRVQPLAALQAGPDDVILIHYSAYARDLRSVLELPNRKLLVSHNVTPARYLWEYEPMVAIHCAVGRAQLPEFARAADLAAGVSEYNARELREAGARRTAVIPLLFDRARLGQPARAGRPAGPPVLLFVGRQTPHKRHDELLRAFALYRAHREPDARLVLVGEPLSPAYAAALERLAERLAPGAVDFERGVPPARLAELYRSAHAFVCLSEHEGFCMPVLEAFHFGVPVVARPSGGVPEVAGDAALLTDDPDLAVVAELVHLAVSDAELRSELRRRAPARLAAFDYSRTAERLHDALTAL
jgi:glycosyltransferase involved in cell wall biosynthesis